MNNYNYQGFNQFEPNYVPNQNDSTYYGNQPNYIKEQSSSPPGVGNLNENPSYAESILNLNKGKNIKVYMSFSDSIEWRDRIFEGTLEAWGRDFLLLNDKKNNKWYMVWTIYINFIEFNEDVIF